MSKVLASIMMLKRIDYSYRIEPHIVPFRVPDHVTSCQLPRVMFLNHFVGERMT
jgi:hypothetical protein